MIVIRTAISPSSTRTDNDPLDGGEPFRAGTDCALRLGASDGGRCLLRPAASDHRLAGSGVATQTCRQGRLAGQVFAAHLPRGDSDLVLVASPRAGALRTCGTNLARSGPPHRAGDCET